MEQRSADWFRLRCGRITGTRFNAAMARRDTQAYRNLIDELVSERVTGHVRHGHISAAMQWGMDYEEMARKWYAKSTKCAVRQVSFVVHPELDFVGVSPDGLVGTKGLVEIKCPQLHTFERLEKARVVPSLYRWQLQGQLWVCQRIWVDFVSFYPEDRGVVLRVEADRNDADRLAERCIEVHSQVTRQMRAHVTHTSRRVDGMQTPTVEARSGFHDGPSPSTRSDQPTVPTESGSPPWWIWLFVLVLIKLIIELILKG